MAATITPAPWRVSSLRDEADAQDVGVAILSREAEALAEVGADDVAVQVVDQDAAPLQLGADDLGDGALSGAGEPGEPEGESRVSFRTLIGPFVVFV